MIDIGPNLVEVLKFCIVMAATVKVSIELIRALSLVLATSRR